ncbi:MAG: hypothetical protein HGA24_11995, partial [Candidatus Aminicenantes bacterium]|nr:hypothetical protein [Candidatus Aminicenantes bacterium]
EFGLPVLFRLFRPRDDEHPERLSQPELARLLVGLILRRFLTRSIELVMDGAYATKAWRGLPGRVTVTALINGWCPGMNMAFERAKRAAAEFGDKVEFRPVDTFDRAVFREWGEPDAIFVDRKSIRMGPPPSYDKIKKAIAKRVKKLD